MSFISGILNDLRDGVLTKKEIQDRKDISNGCTIAKVIAVAAIAIGVAMAIFSLLSGSILGAVLGTVASGLAILAAYDIYRIADNLQKIADDAKTELFTRLTKDAFKERLSRGTIFAKPLIRWVIDDAVKKR